MSEVPCPHECQDESHHYPVIKHTQSVLQPPEQLFEVTEPKHEWPNCEGGCKYPACPKLIKYGQMKKHLVDCHGLDQEVAQLFMDNLGLVEKLLRHFQKNP